MRQVIIYPGEDDLPIPEERFEPLTVAV
jgi:hypothetical protein